MEKGYKYTIDDQDICCQITVYKDGRAVAGSSSTKEHAEQDAKKLVQHLINTSRKEHATMSNAEETAVATTPIVPTVATPVSPKGKSKKSVKSKPVAPAKEKAVMTTATKKHAVKKTAEKTTSKKEESEEALDKKRIKMLVHENPHHSGTSPYKVFELLKKSKTVGDFVKAVHSHKIGDGSRGRAMLAIKYRVSEKHIALS